MAKRIIRVGSRESKLAVVQTQIIIDLIKQNNPDIEFELITMKTTGDIILDKSLDKIGGKGLFVKELDHALMNGKIDISVHSLKDMPMEIPQELPIIALSKREDPRDVLILPLGETELNLQKNIGCSSARRQLQLKNIFEDIKVAGIRGNVITRLNKLDNGEYGGLVLSCAGINRLGLSNRISRIFTATEMIPAAGQGILAIQGRQGEDYAFLQCANDRLSQYVSAAEREFVRTLNGGCSSPIAAYAEISGSEIHLSGLYFDEITGKSIVGEITGDISEAQSLGNILAEKLRKEVLI